MNLAAFIVSLVVVLVGAGMAKSKSWGWSAFSIIPIFIGLTALLSTLPLPASYTVSSSTKTVILTVFVVLWAFQLLRFMKLIPIALGLLALVASFFVFSYVIPDDALVSLGVFGDGIDQFMDFLDLADKGYDSWQS